MSTDGQVAGRAPIYARLLRLRRIKITGLMSFLLLECTVAVAILLALAELVSWWAVPLLPILVAVMVKVNDMVGGPAKTPVAVAAAGARASRVPPQRDEASTPFFDDEPDADEPVHDLPDAREPAPAERERVEVRTGGWTVDRPTEEIVLPAALTGRPRQRQSAWTEHAAMEHAATTEFQMVTDEPPSEHGADAHGYAQDHSRAARAVNEAYAAYESPDDAPAGRSAREVYETHEFPGVRDTADAYGREVYETHEFPGVRDTVDAYGGQTYGYGSRSYAADGYAASSEYVAPPAYEAGERAQPEAYRQAGYETAHEYSDGYAGPDYGHAAHGYTAREDGGARYPSGEHEVHGYASHEQAAYASGEYAAHASGEHAAYASGEYAAHANAGHTHATHDYDSWEHRHAVSENAYEHETAHGYTDREYAGNQRVAAYESAGRDTSNSGRHAAIAPSAQRSGDHAAVPPSAQRSSDYAAATTAAQWSGDHAAATPAAQWSGDHAARSEPVWPAEAAAAGNTWSMAETVPAVPVVQTAHVVREGGAHADPTAPATQTAFPAQAAPVARAMSAGSLAAAGSALTARGRSVGEAPQRSTDQSRTAAPARGADDRSQQPARQGSSHAASYWSRVAAGQGPGMPTARPEGGIPPNLPGAAAPRRAQLFGAAVRRSMAAQAQQIGMNALGGTTRGASTRRSREAGSDTGRHSRGEGNGTGRQSIRFNDRGFGRLRDA